MGIIYSNYFMNFILSITVLSFRFDDKIKRIYVRFLFLILNLIFENPTDNASRTRRCCHYPPHSKLRFLY